MSPISIRAERSIPEAARAPRQSWWSLLCRAIAVRAQRRALLALDDRMLKDIGASRSDAYREAHRSFLDLPEECTGRRYY